MTAPIAPHRSVRIPRLMRLVRGSDRAMGALSEMVEPQSRLLFVHSGATSATRYGPILAANAASLGFTVGECEVRGNTEASVERVANAVDAFGPDFLVGIGGGRVVDVAKLAAARRQVEAITVPTQFASDAVCSPVAIIADGAGNQQSVGARMPVGIIVDLDVLDSAPAASWRAGLGDLVSNLSAVRDWRLAHETRSEEFDDFACLTSEAAALSVIEDDADLFDGDYRQKLIRGLILSGIAMEMAGSSRPASGSEHLISHALDRVLPQPLAHGLQVALGTIAAGVLRRENTRRMVTFFRLVGLPVVPGDLGITIDEFMTAVRLGPSTRPGRTTCLDDMQEHDFDRLRETYSSDLL